MPPTTATLSYATPLGGPGASDLDKQVLMSAVPLYQPPPLPCSTDPVLGVLFDATVTSDVTAPSGGNMVRTLTLSLGPGFFALFPTVFDWENAFNSLYDRTLALALAATVTAQPVIFT